MKLKMGKTLGDAKGNLCMFGRGAEEDRYSQNDENISIAAQLHLCSVWGSGSGAVPS